MAVCEVCGKRQTNKTTLSNALRVLQELEGDELQSFSDLIGELASKATEIQRVAKECSQAEVSASKHHTQQTSTTSTFEGKLDVLKERASSALMQNASELQRILHDVTTQQEGATGREAPLVPQDAEVESQTPLQQAAETVETQESPNPIESKISASTAALSSDQQELTEQEPVLEKSPSFGEELPSVWQSPEFGSASPSKIAEQNSMSATMPPALPSPRPAFKPGASLFSKTSVDPLNGLKEVVSSRPGAALEIAVAGSSGAMNPIAKRRQAVQQHMALGKSARIPRHYVATTPRGASKPVSQGNASNQSGSAAGTPLQSPRGLSPPATADIRNSDAPNPVTTASEKPVDSPLSSACPVPLGPPTTRAPPQKLHSASGNPYDDDVSPMVSPTGSPSPPRSPATGAFFNGPSSKLIEPAITNNRDFDDTASGFSSSQRNWHSSSHNTTLDVAHGGSQHYSSSRVPEDLLLKDDMDWDPYDDQGEDVEFHVPEPACRTKGFMAAPPPGSSWGGALSMKAPAPELAKPAAEPPKSSRAPSKSRALPTSEDLDDPVADLKRTLQKESHKASQQVSVAAEPVDPDDPLEDLRRTLGGRDRSSAPSRDSSVPNLKAPQHVPVAPTSERPLGTYRPRPGGSQPRKQGESSRASAQGRSCFGGARPCDVSLAEREQLLMEQTPLSSSIRDQSLISLTPLSSSVIRDQSLGPPLIS